MLKILFALILSLLVVSGSAFIYFKLNNPFLVSPVLGVSNIRIAENLWFPKESTTSAAVDKDAKLEVTARAAYFVETQTGEVLYEKNIHEKLRIASLTKIMTAIITLEKRDLDEVIDISDRAANMEPDKMLLRGGEKMRVRDLLSGIFLVSANDAAEALAEETTGNREEFINIMNSKAVQLGMTNTLFINPSGLEEDDPGQTGELKSQYSSAYDVLIMSRYLIKRYPEVIDISREPHIFIPATDTHQDYDLYSGINLLTTYPGVVGLKTGFTPEAGLTLVTVARKGNNEQGSSSNEVIGVLLGSTNRRDDAKALLDYSFKKLGY